MATCTQAVYILLYNIFSLQDIAFNFVIAGLIFCAAVALAVYIPRWQDFLANPENNAFSRGVLERVIGSSGAAAVSLY